MSNGIVDAVRRIAAAHATVAAQPRWGFVTSVDPAGPHVRLSLQPEGTDTGWLPVCIQNAGAGTTFAVIPDLGWMAFVVPDMGYQDSLVVVGFAPNAITPMPLVQNVIGTGGMPASSTAPAVAGEVIVRTKAGTTLRLCANGDVVIRPGSGNLLVDGTVRANGDVYDRHGSLDRLRGNYDAHTHGGVQSGGSNTSTTSNPDPE